MLLSHRVNNMFVPFPYCMQGTEHAGGRPASFLRLARAAAVTAVPRQQQQQRHLGLASSAAAAAAAAAAVCTATCDRCPAGLSAQACKQQ